jgi:hypothetical protein
MSCFDGRSFYVIHAVLKEDGFPAGLACSMVLFGIIKQPILQVE